MTIVCRKEDLENMCQLINRIIDLEHRIEKLEKSIGNHKKIKFEIGDRVRVYHHIAEKGTIQNFNKEKTHIFVMSDYGDPEWYNIKQCRKLKKKEKNNDRQKT